MLIPSVQYVHIALDIIAADHAADESKRLCSKELFEADPRRLDAAGRDFADGYYLGLKVAATLTGMGARL